MDFRFSEDQILVRKTVRELLQKECSPSRVRASWASETGTLPDLWAQLAALGVVGLTVPEAHGGLGFNELDLVLLLEEAGRVALPDPLVDTTAVGAPLLAEIAGPALQERWLPAVAAGRCLIATGLQGTALVNHAAAADLLLLEHEGELHALTPAEVQLSHHTSVDGARKVASVTWTPSPSTLIATAAMAQQAIKDAFDRGALGTSAELLGIAQQMLDQTVDYTKLRTQFGKPIGSFQAVKHHLANALLALEMARPVVYRAAYSMAHRDADRSIHVSAAKARASDAALLVARIALQCHGAIGYSFEHDLHLWMKRAWALAPSFGDAAFHRARVGRAIL